MSWDSRHLGPTFILRNGHFIALPVACCAFPQISRDILSYDHITSLTYHRNIKGFLSLLPQICQPERDAAAEGEGDVEPGAAPDPGAAAVPAGRAGAHHHLQSPVQRRRVLRRVFADIQVINELLDSTKYAIDFVI